MNGKIESAGRIAFLDDALEEIYSLELVSDRSNACGYVKEVMG